MYTYTQAAAAAAKKKEKKVISLVRAQRAKR